MSLYKRVVKHPEGTNLYFDLSDEKNVVAVDEKDLPQAVKEELDLGDEGVVFDSDTITQGDGDGVANTAASDADKKESTDPDELTPAEKKKAEENKKKAEKRAADKKKAENNETPDTDEELAAKAQRAPRTATFKSKTPQTEEGFGFPRKGGKTVDIFDGKTPHTHVRVVEGFHVPVPLSAQNYNEKTDQEILDRLEELKLV